MSLDVTTFVLLWQRRTSVPSFNHRCDSRRVLVLLWVLAFILCACTLNEELPSPPAVTPTPTEIIIQPTATETLPDVAALFDGICFEAAHALSGRTFILHSQNDLDALYQQIDNTQHCKRPILRHNFDFVTQSIVGTWTYSPQGCTAEHNVDELEIVGEGRVIILNYRFSTQGTCPYELIRPLWVAVDNPEQYDIQLNITP